MNRYTHRYTTIKKIKNASSWNAIVHILTWNLLWSLCQVSGKQRLLTSWLNRDQGTCHIENLQQAPFGRSQGHSVCDMEKKDLPNSPFNHVVHAESTTHLSTVGFVSDVTKNFDLLIRGTLSGPFFNSLVSSTSPFARCVQRPVV